MRKRVTRPADGGKMTPEDTGRPAADAFYCAHAREGELVFAMNNETVRAFLGMGFALTLQLHLKPDGRTPRYTVTARHERTRESHQGWGYTADEALADLLTRAGLD